MKRPTYFSVFETVLLTASVLLIVLSFALFDRQNYLTFVASLVGVVSLVLNAKANPVGQILIVVFSVLYGVVAYGYAYYGEMITYLGMTAPMAVLALVSWWRHRVDKTALEIKVNHLGWQEILCLFLLTAGVTTAFFFILNALHTANIIPSTLSVATSFVAAYLTIRRSPCFALAYAANDVVLLVLWILATMENSGYLSVVVCFGVFLVNDLYGFVNWLRIGRRQQNDHRQGDE